jgi:hypothetical protein
MEARPVFLQGVYSYVGRGLGAATPLGGGLAYLVPSDKRSQLIYLRAGNSAGELACITLTRDGAPLRLFPVGARAAIHVPLSVVEDLYPESRLEVLVSASAGVSGEIVLDIGLLEI